MNKETVERISPADDYAQRASTWDNRDLWASTSQVGLVVAAGLIASTDWTSAPTVSAVLFLLAAVAWTYRLVAQPSLIAKLLRAQATRAESMSVRYAMRSAVTRSWSEKDQFQTATARQQVLLVDAYGVGEAPLVLPYKDFEPTTSMQHSRTATLGQRIATYRVRVDTARSELTRVALAARRRAKTWTGVGISLEIGGIASAIWQATGGPSGLVGIASLLAAGALAWSETRDGTDGRVALWKAIHTLDAMAPRLLEVHTEVSWALLVDEIETAIEAVHTGIPSTNSTQHLAM